ncbi:hypothetical protein HAHE_17490 [Haloferula helveola]|uniref:Uncharacterized protein n=1 Tax=Haloferula helveola TaxID=490095 RepID=A0ABN6H2Q8_9BACT|nr:hypothetical protein HAHE_17490 [Haloferula helveola]
MELKFTPLRVAMFVVFMVGFGLAGGYVFPPDLPYRSTRALALAILLFTLSAVSATVVDHWVGNLDRSNLRWFYIIAGVCGMAIAVVIRFNVIPR